MRASERRSALPLPGAACTAARPLARPHPEQQATSARPHSAEKEPAPAAHSFQRLVIHPAPRGTLQLKGMERAPADPLEQEADQTADQVLRMPAPLQGEACAECGPKGEAPGQDPEAQRPRLPANEVLPEAPPQVQEVLTDPGQPLAAEARAFLEPRFGHDFSALRVHADSRAAESAQQLGARAYTAGRHVVFGPGEYAPHTPSGRRLLAHEATHVLQQSPPTPAAAETEAGEEPVTSTATTPQIQKETPDAPPPARQKVTRIILDKQQNVLSYVLEEGPPESSPILKHCDPKAGTYTAHVRTNAARTEQLDWITDQNVGCTLSLGYIVKTEGARQRGTLEGVTSLEFEVRDEPPAATAGETATETGTGGAAKGEGAGAAETTAPEAVEEPPRGIRQIWSEIQALPAHIQEFLIDPRAAIMPSAEAYETVLRIGEKLAAAGVAADELYQYQRVTNPLGNYADFEARIDRFLATRATAQAERTQNVLSRERTRTRLFGLDVLYRRYLALRKALGKSQNLAAVAGTTIQATGVSPDLIRERDELNADLIRADFKRGIPEFEEFIQKFASTFERETVAIAFDVLRKYQYLLLREYAQFEGDRAGPNSKAAKLLTSLAKVREPAQALYELADEERNQADRVGASRRGVKGETWEGDHVRAAALRRSADAHEAEAEKLVAAGAADLPVIGWQDFPRRKLVGRTTAEDVRYEIAWYLATHEAAIQRARNLLQSKPEHLYELDNLLEFSYAAQDIQPGSIYDLIIQDRRRQIKSSKTAREILVAVITVALAIVSFGGGTLGLLAAGAAFGISAAQAATALEEYDAQTTLYMAQLLKTEPTAAWAIIAVIGAGLDAGAVVQALKVVVPAAKAFNATGDLLALEKGLAGVEQQVQAQVLRAAQQARVVEQELKAAVGELKTMFTSPGRKLRSVGLPGGELLGNLVAISYYYLRSRALRSFERFVAQLEKEGLVVWSKLSIQDQQALRQAFDQALELSTSRQLPYGQAIFDQLSPRARTAFPVEATDRFAAQGKALGKTDQEIIDTLEAEARRAEILEGTGQQKLVDPSEAGDVRPTAEIHITDYDPTLGDSGRLTENLTAAGRPNPRAGFPRENFQAHHIIPSNEGPEELRELLRRHRLDINGEFNGVWLPTGKNAPNPTGAMRHDYLTGNQEYFARLSAILLKEPPLTREQVISKLQAIAEYLQNGKFPPPRL